MSTNPSTDGGCLDPDLGKLDTPTPTTSSINRSAVISQISSNTNLNIESADEKPTTKLKRKVPVWSQAAADLLAQKNNLPRSMRFAPQVAPSSTPVTPMAFGTSAFAFGNAGFGRFTLLSLDAKKTAEPEMQAPNAFPKLPPGDTGKTGQGNVQRRVLVIITDEDDNEQRYWSDVKPKGPAVLPASSSASPGAGATRAVPSETTNVGDQPAVDLPKGGNSRSIEGPGEFYTATIGKMKRVVGPRAGRELYDTLTAPNPKLTPVQKMRPYLQKTIECLDLSFQDIFEFKGEFNSVDELTKVTDNHGRRDPYRILLFDAIRCVYETLIHVDALHREIHGYPTLTQLMRNMLAGMARMRAELVHCVGTEQEALFTIHSLWEFLHTSGDLDTLHNEYLVLRPSLKTAGQVLEESTDEGDEPVA